MIHALLALLVVTGQLLDFERGWVVLTSGDALRVAPGVRVVNGPATARRYVRLTLDPDGTVNTIELSAQAFPVQGQVEAHRFAVQRTPSLPNPELNTNAQGSCGRVRAGKVVGVTVTVEVPPETSMLDAVYMTSDQSGWNAQAYRLDRVDALHYRATLKLASGTAMHVLFDRGSMQQVEVAENGIEQRPYLLCVSSEDAQAFTRTVYRWADTP